MLNRINEFENGNRKLRLNIDIIGLVKSVLECRLDRKRGQEAREQCLWRVYKITLVLT